VSTLRYALKRMRPPSRERKAKGPKGVSPENSSAMHTDPDLKMLIVYVCGWNLSVNQLLANPPNCWCPCSHSGKRSSAGGSGITCINMQACTDMGEYIQQAPHSFHCTVVRRHSPGSSSARDFSPPLSPETRVVSSAIPGEARVHAYFDRSGRCMATHIFVQPTLGRDMWCSGANVHSALASLSANHAADVKNAVLSKT
jgi:hypothetical protein